MINIGCYLRRSCGHLRVVAGEVLVEVVEIVEIEVDPFNRIIVRFMDLQDTHHQDFS